MYSKMYFLITLIMLSSLNHIMGALDSDTSDQGGDDKFSAFHKLCSLSDQDFQPTIFHVKGTHHSIGVQIGQKFKTMIKDFLASYTSLPAYLKAYNTPEGRAIYDDSLTSSMKYFPQYVRELQGMASGADVEFHVLFLVLLDDTLTMNMPNATPKDAGPVGCTSILVNQEEFQALGHNEDALKETSGHYYIISANVKAADDEKGGTFKPRDENWKAVVYAASLPGYASGVNANGVAYSINTIFASKQPRRKIPRGMITRALLSAKADLNDIIEILTNDRCVRGDSCGTADAFNVNLGFFDPELTGGKRIFYNLEVTPDKDNARSIVSLATISAGHNGLHINKLLYSGYAEIPDHSGVISSVAKTKRYRQLTKDNPITDMDGVLRVLGDTDPTTEWQIFRSRPGDFVYTIHTGVIDFTKKIWYIWPKNPRAENVTPIEIRLTFDDQN
ncbi:uncharacterized protein LOC126832992 isoform X2 [Adelges cooleyi]|uniref:uncharacterized protein LOC126832992 isoform X2 n=1 Tax=Adelges cooleyi TaxID=133065 RepID=UPI0021804681|nr:uncharacterized protein LOC126832992 isoform X2 [Adelges cooleyi]